MECTITLGKVHVVLVSILPVVYHKIHFLTDVCEKIMHENNIMHVGLCTLVQHVRNIVHHHFRLILHPMLRRIYYFPRTNTLKLEDVTVVGRRY